MESCDEPHEMLVPHGPMYTYGMAQPRFWWGSDAPGPRFGETLNPMEKSLTFPSTPIDVRRKGVAQWTFLLGCVRLGHRKVFYMCCFYLFTCICCRVGFRETRTVILRGWDTEIGRAIIGPIYI